MVHTAQRGRQWPLTGAVFLLSARRGASRVASVLGEPVRLRRNLSEMPGVLFELKDGLRAAQADLGPRRESLARGQGPD